MSFQNQSKQTKIKNVILKIKGYFTYETVMLIMAFALLVGFLIFSYIEYHRTHNSNFWTNYWTGAPLLITVVAGLASFYVQSHIDRKNKNRDKYLAFQDEVERDIFPKFITFFSNAKQSDEKLVQDLNAILLTTKKLDSQREILIPNASRDQEIEDYSDEFKSKTGYIVTQEKYKTIVQLVAQSSAALEGQINDLQAEYKQQDEKKRQDREKLRITKPDTATNRHSQKQQGNGLGVFDDYITKAWILKKSSAESAKYLIGVSTKDKRIVGAYNLNQATIIIGENKRVEFQLPDTHSRLYVEGQQMRPVLQYLPGLKHWTAMNPVLYYLAYLKSSNITLQDSDKKQLASFLLDQKTDLANAEKFLATLSDRDIVVVRTFKFDN